jgi:hypothetical protein
MQSLTESKLFSQVIDYLKSLGYENLESGFRYSTSNRAPISVDIMIFDDQHKPFAIVEVKSNLPQDITKFHPAVDQAYRYSRQLNAPYFLVTDGENMSWYQVNTEAQSFEPISDPPKNRETQVLQLRTVDPDEITNQMYEVIDLLRTSGKHYEWEVILAAFLLAKIFDEEHTAPNLAGRFQVFPGEDASLTQLRIAELFQFAIEEHSLPIKENVINKLEALLVQSIVKKIEYIHVRGNDLIGKFVEGSNNISKISGAFYTHGPIANLFGRLFDFKSRKSVLDPALGTGGFLAAVANHIEKTKGSTPQLVGVEINSNVALLAAAECVNEMRQLF